MSAAWDNVPRIVTIYLRPWDNVPRTVTLYLRPWEVEIPVGWKTVLSTGPIKLAEVSNSLYTGKKKFVYSTLTYLWNSEFMPLKK